MELNPQFCFSGTADFDTDFCDCRFQPVKAHFTDRSRCIFDHEPHFASVLIANLLLHLLRCCAYAMRESGVCHHVSIVPPAA